MITEQMVKAIQGRAARRRAALVAGGCATYEIRKRFDGESIICLCCGSVSYNAGDIARRYCFLCHDYHSDWGPDDNHITQS